MLIDGHDGSLSSKRVITFLAFILCSIAFVADLFWDYNVSPNVFEGMIYIAIAGLGVTASEKFANRSAIAPTTNTPSNPPYQQYQNYPPTPYYPPNPGYQNPINNRRPFGGTPLPRTEEKEL